MQVKLVSKQWQEIGFQGEDPCTDFRGMGLLALENLLYFAVTHESAARHVLSRSCHPRYGYSFGIVGINLTHLALTLLKDGALKHHFYNVAVKEMKEAALSASSTSGTAGVQLPSLRHFHQVYCYIFFEFDSLWRNEKPRDIMEFNRVRDLFEKKLRAQLKSYDCILKTNFVLRNV
ncbi:hypothetical protein HAZT_HAZT004336 [Hyalella azteca]|uniref:ELMO domain-containing protein n=1 Tax=Hyalella azteca TaxID=294128 RepID=A0A6A0GT78_HYAAZ|nr:hypothetical protein HAZT_HAZT004336 [Hyalella azteca]